MIRRIILYLIFIIAFTFCGFAFLKSLCANINTKKHNPAQASIYRKPKNVLPDYAGEKITYNVKLGKIYLGQSYFNYLDKTTFKGKPVNVMLFETKLARFSDTEKIYGDPNSFLPLKIERAITNLFKREEITEDYDQDKFTLTITAKKGGKSDKTIIHKSGPINNSILIPHYIRIIPDLKVGSSFNVNLPNRQAKIKLVSIEEVKIAAGIFSAYHFESSPKQIEMWITTDQRHIPIKIQGTGLFGYMLEMKGYTPPNLKPPSKVLISSAK